MASDDDDMRVVTTATDEIQQSIIIGRLSDAGIHCMGSGAQLPRRGAAGPRDVYVRAADLERARALLKEDEGSFDEDELAHLSEEAGRTHPAEP
jgi:hypothetical protein